METEFNCHISGCMVQGLFPNPSWMTSGRTPGHQKLVPTFPYIDCLMVTEWDFLGMEASLWLNKKSQNGSVTKGWLSTLCCWEEVVAHTLNISWKKIDVKMMMDNGQEHCSVTLCCCRGPFSVLPIQWFGNIANSNIIFFQMLVS